MIGAAINVAGIVLGGVLGLTVKKSIPAKRQSGLQAVLGVFILWFGLKLTWNSLNGSFRQVLKQLAIVLLAMTLGKLLGKLLHLQKESNRVGQFATRKMEHGGSKKFSDGFLVATGLFCIGPLTPFASVQEGLAGFAPIFIVKAIMDGLAAMAFARMFGWGVLVSALPVFALQATIIRTVRLLEPTLHQQALPLIDSIYATDGLLIFCVSLIILQLKKIEVADYLPSLALAPLLTWLLR